VSAPARPPTGAFASGEHIRRLRAALLVTASVLVLEVAGGIAAGSLALLADAAHVLGDIAALLLAWAAASLAGRAPTGRHTFGFARAEVLAAFVNAQILLVIGGGILWEGVRRFRNPPTVQTGLMLAFALVGLAGNLIAMRLLTHGHGHKDNLNMRAAFLEVASDAAGSAAVVMAALLMPRTGAWWLDAAVSIAVAVLFLPRAVSILRQSAHILLEGAPRDVDLAGIRSRLLAVPGVVEVHDLHLWTLSSGRHSASVHIRASHEGPDEHAILDSVQRVLRVESGLDHATVQVECGSGPDCRDASVSW
jgi:cobalt-zinc-cadmium efflux system protein